ncbi:hypothetical protein HTSR_2009 [Halodesulfurarchaeum formicicum]|uniref:DUF8173 domain-containing protein n=1 Tax=Halodesulfurarchaeum formicicum TaxID=1873524 RepID=A0A1D8S737_9EURY|nr:polymer-forming cytoskeletal protein [Halodesulfurarchaeum formicicum]AOW81170.1 hypothetical protein HTSR_2009 [Halodesulfurarchaeum formicicum]APE96513.1 hypothetical protein HSR6_2085 [Halodesulfurarchaeum formicicum]
MNHHTSRSRIAVILLVVLLSLGLGIGPAAAQTGSTDSTMMSGTVIVDADETVEGFTVMAGTIVVRGTVTGDLEGFGGDVVVAESGVVQGDLSVASGSLRIAGAVDGSVSAGTGSLVLTPTGRVGGDFSAGAGSVLIEGQIDGNADVGAETITLGPTAVIGGELRYDGALTQQTGATVGGSVVQDSELGTFGPVGVSGYSWPTMGWLDAVYGLFANLLLGAVLLFLVPSFSEGVATRATESTGRSALVGLLALLGIPVVLVLIAVTIVGIPLAVLGVFAYLFLLWAGVVYGEYAVGHWLLARRTDPPNRWYALGLGLLLFTILGAVPLIGGLFVLAALLVGMGALASALWGSARRRRGSGATPTTATDDTDTASPA